MNKPGWVSRGWVIVLLWIGSLSVSAQTPASVRRLYTNALSYLPDSISRAKILADSAWKMALTLETNHDSLFTRCNFLLGVVHLYKSEAYLSEAYFKEALQTRTAKENLQLRENCFNNLGIAYDYQNRVKEALEAYYASLHIAKERKDSFSIAQSWINIAFMERKTGNYQRGIALTKKVLDYSIRHLDSLNIGLCHQNLFIFYHHIAEDSLAKWHREQALKTFRRINNQYNLSLLLVDIANAEEEAGNLPGALRYFEEAERVARTNTFEDIWMMAMMGRGKVQMKLPGGLDEAAYQMLNSLKISSDMGRTEYKESIYQTLADIYARKGDLSAYTMVSDTLHNLREQQQHRATQSAYDELNAVHALQELKQKNTIRDQQYEIYHKRVELIVLLAFSLLAVFAFLFLFFQQRYKLKDLHLHQALLERKLNEKKLVQERLLLREKEEVITQQKQELASTAVQQIKLKEELQALMDELKGSVEIDLPSRMKGFEKGGHWEGFLDKFNLINPSFIQLLSKKYPSLNQSELVFCALVKLNLSFKEIANVLHIAHRSVHMKKYRITKKMALLDEDFIREIVSIDVHD